MSASRPYGLSTWVPVLLGGAAPPALETAEAGYLALHRRLVDLAPGERLAVLVEGGADEGARALPELEARCAGRMQVERFVVLPGTGAGFALIPTNSTRALRGSLPLLPAGPRRFGAARLGLEPVAPFEVARRLGLTELWLATAGLRRSFGDALAADGEHVAVTSGPAGPLQKLAARVIACDGRTRTFVKLAHRAGSAGAVMHERRMLERVHALLPGLGPELLDRGEHEGLPWFTAEVLEGQRSPDVLTEGHVALLQRLAQATLGRAAIGEVAVVARSVAALDTSEARRDAEWYEPMSALAAHLRGDAAPLATHLAHGDFVPWNLCVSPHGTRAFDWERALEDAPALYDVFHFHVVTGALVHRADARAVLGTLRTSLEYAVRPLVALCGARGIDLTRAFAAHLLHASVRDEEVRRIEPIPVMGMAALRRLRVELARVTAAALGAGEDLFGAGRVTEERAA